MARTRTTHSLAHPKVHPLGCGYGVMWHGDPVSWEDDDVDAFVEVDLEVEDGQLAIQRLTVMRRPGGGPITIDTLKSLPLMRITGEAAADGVFNGFVRVTKAGRGVVKVEPADLGDLDDLSEAERASIIYRLAHFYGLAPTSAVAAFMDLTYDAAAKRVQAARLAGLLEPTSRGKKGT